MSQRLSKVRDSSVTRDLLQPHMRGAKGTSVNSVRTVTQQVIEETIRNTVGARQESDSEYALMCQIVNAEYRAKAYVERYQQGFRWEIRQDKELVADTWHPIAFDTEVLRCFNARSVGDVTQSTGTWRHRCVKGHEGRWHYHASILLALGGASSSTRVQIAFFKNGELWGAHNGVDDNYAGDAFTIYDVVLDATEYIPMREGDYVDVRIFITAGTGATGTFYAPSSVQGMIMGFRTISDDDVINKPTAAGDGTGYTFI